MGELETDIPYLEKGKQARANPDESSRAKHEHSPPSKQQPAKNMALRASDPGFSHATAHVIDPGHPQVVDVKAKQKRIPDENIAKLVAEENESKSKFPHYPGLERWELVEKMGDGAFSNVYRARDREGTAGEVAVKVVRKFEMNSMQVRGGYTGLALFVNPFSLLGAVSFVFSKFPFTNIRGRLERQTSPSRL